MRTLRNWILLLLVFSALFLSEISFGQESYRLIQEGQNQNFIYERDQKSLVTSVDFVIRAGNLSDPKGKEGLAALSFASLLRGTKDKDRKTFDAEIEKLGASIGVDTASSRTIISLDTIEENYEKSVQLLAEAVLEPRLDEKELAALKVEVLAALQQEKANNRALLKRAIRKVIFAGSALEIPPSGNLSSIQKITAEDIRAFLKSQTVRKNIVIAVNSNLEEQKIREPLERFFRPLSQGAKTSSASWKRNPIVGQRLVLIERPGSSTTEMAVGHFGIEANRPDREALELGLFLFGGDMSSRLFQELRAKKGWTYGVYSSFQFVEIPRRHGSAFVIYAFPHAEHTQKALTKTLQLYRDYAKNGVTAKELAFAKSTMKNSYAFQFASSRAKLTGRLYEFLDGAPLLPVESYRKLIDGMSVSQLRKSIQAIHDPNNLWIVLVGDPKALDEAQKSLKQVKEVVRFTPDQLIP